MGKIKRIEIGSSNSGIVIEYIKSRKTLSIWGYYDDCAGIEGKEITLLDFMEQLGIKERKQDE